MSSLYVLIITYQSYVSYELVHYLTHVNLLINNETVNIYCDL